LTDGNGRPDVAMPSIFTNSSGWDINRVYFQYDDLADDLLIAVECFGVCGDADGDGDEGRTSENLHTLGGKDLHDLTESEGFAMLLDFDLDVGDVAPVPGLLFPYDFIIGVPSLENSFNNVRFFFFL
jgi:hypothetical protein